jgi:hypothetical protein
LRYAKYKGTPVAMPKILKMCSLHSGRRVQSVLG